MKIRIRDYLPKSKMTYILLFAAVIVSILLAIYVYRTSMKKQLNPDYVENKEYIQETDSNNVQVIFFTVDWCPHCKKSKPVWDEFCKKYNDKTVNNYKISCETFNCTNENDNIVKRTIDKYKIEGYPTIKLIMNGEVYDYEAKPSMEHLEQWIQVTLN